MNDTLSYSRDGEILIELTNESKYTTFNMKYNHVNNKE